MGWGSGGSLMGDIMVAAQKYIPDEVARRAFYVEVINAFEERDCDTLDELEGADPAFDGAMWDVHPIGLRGGWR